MEVIITTPQFTLNLRRLLIILFAFILTRCTSTCTAIDVNSFAEKFAKSSKINPSSAEFIDSISCINISQLNTQLDNDDQKKAFWINIYNGVVQCELYKKNSPKLTDAHFFEAKRIQFQDVKLSLNDIEHGILRRVPNTTISTIEPIKRKDPRIHFALNCGARSCPPFHFYSAETINKQLLIAERTFIKSTSSYNIESNTLTISEIFRWYAEDFGGKNGIDQLMRAFQICPIWASPKTTYSPYDWRTEN